MYSPGAADRSDSTPARRLCLSILLLYNRLMALDPANPPIWLRKLHVTAAQIDPTDYPATPEEGILLCCRLSDAHVALAKVFHSTLYPYSPHPKERKA